MFVRPCCVGGKVVKAAASRKAEAPAGVAAAEPGPAAPASEKRKKDKKRKAEGLPDSASGLQQLTSPKPQAAATHKDSAAHDHDRSQAAGAGIATVAAVPPSSAPKPSSAPREAVPVSTGKKARVVVQAPSPAASAGRMGVPANGAASPAAVKAKAAAAFGSPVAEAVAVSAVPLSTAKAAVSQQLKSALKAPKPAATLAVAEEREQLRVVVPAALVASSSKPGRSSTSSTPGEREGDESWEGGIYHQVGPTWR